MARFHIIAIRAGYSRLETLQASRHEALCSLVRWSMRRACAVVLRDGATGARVSVEAAQTKLGFSWIERWQPERWFARVDQAAVEQMAAEAA